MTTRRRLLGTLTAAATLGIAPTAFAAAYLYQPAAAQGGYFTDTGIVVNTNPGQTLLTSDGSNYKFVTCVGSEPGQPGCSVTGLPPPSGAWYELPALPSSAAAQAWTPDYGTSRVRAWSSGLSGVNTGAPGFTAYTASAQSGWHEEINTTSAVPVVITFVVALHVSWNDGGVFSFQMGRPGTYDPDVGGSTPMLGHTWTNCANCQFGYDTGSARTVLPGADDGSADLIVTVPFTVYPDSFADPENSTPFTNPFESILSGFAAQNGAEVQAYSSANLQAILVPPNAGLQFASGHAYTLQAVPEPATWALWCCGLAVAAATLRRQRAAPGT